MINKLRGRDRKSERVGDEGEGEKKKMYTK